MDCGGEESGGSREWQINRFLRNLSSLRSLITFATSADSTLCNTQHHVVRYLQLFPAFS